MPLWHINHPKGTITSDEKRELSGQITGLYSRLPKFYVNVVFHEFAAEDFFVGGEPSDKHVTISIDQFARTIPEPERRHEWMEVINQRLAPYFKDRGLHCEIVIDETPFDLWTIDAYLPPAAGSADERRWAAENRPSPLTGS